MISRVHDRFFSERPISGDARIVERATMALYVATEGKRRGPGGRSQVACKAGVTRKTIRKGMQEAEFAVESIRR